MYLHQIKLKNFRQFKKASYKFGKHITLISGNNTQGKSTILEAIAIATSGQSPWTSQHEDLINREESFYRIEAEIVDDTQKTQLNVIQDGSAKKFEVNGKATTRNRFLKHSACNLFSPEQIEILMISPSKRREFLNDLIVKIDPEYQRAVHTFEKILRQRNSYLKKLSKHLYETGEFLINDKNLEFWNEKFTETAAFITQKRAYYIDKLSYDDILVNFRPSVSLSGFEEMAEEKYLVTLYKEKITESIRKDIATGYTQVGPHRDDWSITTENDKDVKRFGSRGEKRIAICKLILHTQDLLKEYLSFYPILLLDDISSELDERNIKLLLQNDKIYQQQTIITCIKGDFLRDALKDKDVEYLNL